MPPVPPPLDPVGATPRSTPRDSRGHIQSYGDGRICVHAGCSTTLSRYNKDMLCWQHAHQRDDLLPRSGTGAARSGPPAGSRSHTA